MNTAFTARVRSDHTRQQQAVNEIALWQSQAQAVTRMFDDDGACEQRNGPPRPDQRLIRAVADLDN